MHSLYIAQLHVVYRYIALSVQKTLACILGCGEKLFRLSSVDIEKGGGQAERIRLRVRGLVTFSTAASAVLVSPHFPIPLPQPSNVLSGCCANVPTCDSCICHRNTGCLLNLLSLAVAILERLVTVRRNVKQQLYCSNSHPDCDCIA